MYVDVSIDNHQGDAVGYTYKIGDTIIKSPKKLYMKDGTYCHKTGDFLVPVPSGLFLKISMALLEDAVNKQEKSKLTQNAGT